MATATQCLVSNWMQCQEIGCLKKNKNNEGLQHQEERGRAMVRSRSRSVHGTDLPVFWLLLLGPHPLGHMLINHRRTMAKNLKTSSTKHNLCELLSAVLPNEQNALLCSTFPHSALQNLWFLQSAPFAPDASTRVNSLSLTSAAQHQDASQWLNRGHTTTT